MGLEEHLLHMFREDFEFHDDAGPSHHGGRAQADTAAAPVDPAGPAWLEDAESELRKVPFFVRGKARRNTERFAAERGLAAISVNTLYEAKAHYAR
jgi:light-independent protochlorophyllide reductase subunit B